MNGNAKTTMDRIGLFSEPGYTTINDPYRQASLRERGQEKGLKPMQIPGSKTKNSTLVGYFSAKFDRIMQGEAFSDPIKLRRQDRLKEKKKEITPKPFMPSNPSKKQSGDGAGTFSGKIEYFSGRPRDREPYSAPPRNLYISPAKKGNGYGYVGVTIGKEYKYIDTDYEAARTLRSNEMKSHKDSLKGPAFKLFNHPTSFFDKNPYHIGKNFPPENEYHPSEKQRPKPFLPSTPAKFKGGSNAGCFDKYPNHSEDLYQKEIVRKEHQKPNIFHPSACPKSKPTTSLVQQNVTKALNSSNFRTVQSVMSY